MNPTAVHVFKLLLRRTLVLSGHCEALRRMKQSNPLNKMKITINNKIASFFAMTIKEQGVQVSDTTGDATKNYRW